MLIYDNEYKSFRKIKIEPKLKLNYNITLYQDSLKL